MRSCFKLQDLICTFFLGWVEGKMNNGTKFKEKYLSQTRNIHSVI